VAQIKLNFSISERSPGANGTLGFEFLNKEGKSILKVGSFSGTTNKVFRVEDNE
jgi:hypothetical protein